MDGKMWFGTTERAEWIPAPLSGADVSPQTRGESGSLVGGGGYVNQSAANHKMYQFSWNDASALQMAHKIRSYASGYYGRSRYLFVDPMTYHTNILPIQWSAPFLTVRGKGEYPSLVRSRPQWEPIWQPGDELGIGAPLYRAEYQITSDYEPGPPPYRDRLIVAIPAGMKLRLGAAYTAEQANIGVYWGPYNGEVTTASNRLTPLAGTETNLLPTTVNGPGMIAMWIGNPAGDLTTRIGTLSVHFIQARLEPINAADSWKMPFPVVGNDRTFYPGQGHSGCRLDGMPTMTYTSAVGDGQAGFSMTMRETGSWEV